MADATQPIPSGQEPQVPSTQTMDAMMASRQWNQDLSGTTLGGYRIVRKMAEGGMGVVYEAVQIALDRKVALKVLTAQLASEPQFLQRFEREAKAAAVLNHPNLVQVYDFGHVQGQNYLVMEYVDGENLTEYVIHHGKLDVTKALDVVEQACEALKAACAKSIIHRDIKPSNLMLTTDGRVKVADLGLAKVLSQETNMTLTGAGMGSPHFLSPEQAEDASRVDHRADIYALGITLLFLLTGRKPYDGATPFSIVLAHANKPLPRGLDLGTDLPEPVETLIQRMAAKSLDERYPDYETLIADVRRVKAGQNPELKPLDTSAPEVPAKKTPMLPVMASALLVIAALIGFWWVMKNRQNPQTISPAKSTPAVTAQTAAPSEPKPEQAEHLRASPPPRENGFDGNPPPMEDGQPPGGPNGQRGMRRFPLSPPPRPNFRALQDGPLPEMIAAADAYAREHTNDFIGISVRYHQVQNMAAGAPEEADLERKIEQWDARHDRASTEALKQFEQKMKTQVREKKWQEAYAVWKDFPSNLRNREIDNQIEDLLEKNLPPDFRPAPINKPDAPNRAN